MVFSSGQFDGANILRKEMAPASAQPEYIPLPGPGGDTISTVTTKDSSPSAAKGQGEVTAATKTATKTIHRPTQLFTPGAIKTTVKSGLASLPARRTPTTPQGINLPVKLKLKDGTLKTPDMEDTPPLVSTFNSGMLTEADLSTSQDSMSSGGSMASKKVIVESPKFTISTAPHPGQTPIV